MDLGKPANMEGARGRSSMHGNSYHLRMTMVVLLRAFTLRREDKLSDFKITMEDPNAGKFDDVVFQYSSPCTPKDLAYVYIQAKHKQTADRVRNVPSITEATLLTKWNSKGAFSIPMYFVSYLNGYEESLAGSHTYILCTNASIDRHLLEYMTIQTQEVDHILSFCDAIGGTCYSFSGENEFKTLTNELRNASLEKLGQMIAQHVKNRKPISCNICIFNIYVTLIAKFVHELDTGIFQFNEGFRSSEDSTAIGIVRSGFMEEYLKSNPKAGPTVEWEKIQIMVDQPLSNSILKASSESYEETSCYDIVNIVIEQFYKKFILVCGSMNATQLGQKIMDIMPNWMQKEAAFSNLTNLLLNGMSETTQLSLQDLKKYFIETNANKNFTNFQDFTKKYQESMQVKYSHIIVDSNCLKDTALNEFIRCTSQYVYRYRCTTNMNMNALIVSQTLALHKYQCLFVNSASSIFQVNISDVLCELMEFITAVDLSTEYIITILGQQEFTALKAIKEYAKLYKMKVIVVEKPAEEDLAEDRLFVCELTDEARRQLFAQYGKLNIYGTIIALDRVVRDEDDLKMLFSVLDKSDDTEGRKSENINQTKFDKIKQWYIARCCVPYSEHKHESEEFLVDKEITEEMLKPIIALKNETSKLPDVLKHEDNVKVHIFLDEAGSGKSTYFTWLASALSRENPSSYVIRMNALQYSTDFRQLQTFDPRTLDDTEIVRILYRLLHYTLIMANANLRSINEEREKAERIAKLFNVLNGKVILDEREMKLRQLTLEDVLELRLFQNKFNERQFICLLDGFDEIAPHYKDFVMRYFSRLTHFKAIRNLYISTRPYNFRDELKHIFSECILWRLEPFSQRERLLFLINYLEHEISDIKISENVNDSITILKSMYLLTSNSIQELKIIPLFLHMAAKISLSTVKTLLSEQQQQISSKIFEETKLDQLQVVRNFVEEKLKLLNNETGETTDSTFNYPIQRMKNDEANKLIKRRHCLVAMFVIFDSSTRTKLLSDLEQQEANDFMREVTEGSEKTGIIREIRDGIPQFTHRIFAEYFAACWLYQNKRDISNVSVFRSWSYWTPELYRVRDFLNRMIVEDSVKRDIHMAVINQSEDQVHECISKDPSSAFVTDVMDRTPLHVAVMYSSIDVSKLLLSKMTPQSINMKDKLLQWTALDYAFASRCKTTAELLLAAEAAVNVDTLLQQILSNNLKNVLMIANDIGLLLKSHENTKKIVMKLHFGIVEHLLNDNHLDVFFRLKELEYLTVLEFCSKHNIIGIFIQLFSQINIRKRISTDEIESLSQIATKHKAHEIEAHLADHRNIPLLLMNDSVGQISVLKSSIGHNQLNSFKHFFQQLCYQLKISLVDDTDIVEDAFEKHSVPPMVTNCYPKVCCVRSSSNVRLSIPEYDEKDILHEGYLIEALLAQAVNEGNMQMVTYIVQKTNMRITNRLIVMVMRLLPKHDDICHEKSMSAFTYLLGKSTDLNSTDDEGRNLLQMTAQNGCFFMVRCLIANGHDPTERNTRNGWNTFHYVAFNQDEDRTDKVLEFLLKQCDMNWFDHLDALVDTDVLQGANKNTRNRKTLNKQQHALLALFVMFKKTDLSNLLSDQEQQEAVDLIREVSLDNVRSQIIKGVKNQIPKFTHLIFAEYFTASWIYKNKDRIRSGYFFLSYTVYWNKHMFRTRSFLNRIIVGDSEGCDIHKAVINQSLPQVRELLSNFPSRVFTKDAVGRLPLHVAAMYSIRDIIKLLLEKMPLSYINAKDEFFHWTAVDYAFARNFPGITNTILDAGAIVNVDTVLQAMLSNNLRNLLLFVVDSHGCLFSRESTKNISVQLHMQIVDHLLNERHVDVFARHEGLDSLTVLEFCCKRDIIGIFKYLASHINVQEKLTSDITNNLFQIASKNKAQNIVAYFVENINTILS